MRWLPSLFPLLLLVVPASADEPPAQPASSAVVELGGHFAPAERTTVRWKTRTELTDGNYTGIRVIAPVTGKIDKTDEREILTTYTPEGRREIQVIKGVINQTATIGGKTEKTEKRQALEGVAVIGRQTDGKWVFAPAAGEPTDEQKPELERLARRANDEVDLFEGVKAKPGDTWTIDPLRFLKAAGFDDIRTARGTAKASLKEVATTPNGAEAVIGLEIDVRAEQAPAAAPKQRLHLEYKGRLIRVLATRLDRRVALEGKMTLSGEVTTDGQRTPFSLVTPVKFQSEREIVKQ